MNKKYWVLFWVAIAMAAHSAIVGRLLGSSFFMLLFFWGWVAAAAYRGHLESAKSMAITMVVILVGTSVALALRPGEFRNELAYYTFALYPALVSWICVYVYVRHLLRREGQPAVALRSPVPQRRMV
jgi:Ca2+/Na+ antiporter